MGAVTKQSTEDGEAHRHLADAVVVETTLPIGGVVGLEVQPEGLLVGAEIGPRGVIHGQVGFNADRVFLRGVAVEDKHLGDFGVDAVGGVVTDRQVLWVEELAHGEVALLVRQDVDGLERGRVVGGPLDVHLNRQVRRGFEHLGDGVDPIHVAREDGGRLSVQPERVRHVEGDVGRHFVVFIRDTIVVAVPVRALSAVGAGVGRVSLLEHVEIGVLAGVVVVVGVDGVGTSEGVVGVGHRLAVTEIVVIPRVGGVATETGGPQQDLVLVLHAVLIVVVVQVVTHAVVVVVKGVDHRVRLSTAGGDLH